MEVPSGGGRADAPGAIRAHHRVHGDERPLEPVAHGLHAALSGVDASGRASSRARSTSSTSPGPTVEPHGRDGERLKEAQSINKSLSRPGTSLALAEKKDARAHVPYRNSKLTYLLQNSLGGDAKTPSSANVAPGAESAQETLCSRFAAKVNGVSQREGGNKAHTGGKEARRKHKHKHDRGDLCETNATFRRDDY